MTTQETTYTIREAARQVNVEAHVLRYWEEELGISIGRNNQGHRCYTKEDVELMEKIRLWRAQGMQLKAIRLMLSEDGRLAVPDEVVREAQAMMGRKTDAAAGECGEQEAAGAPAASEERTPDTAAAAAEKVAAAEKAVVTDVPGEMPAEAAAPEPAEGRTLPPMGTVLLDGRGSKAARLQLLLENLVSRAVQENSAEILKALDGQFQKLEENAQTREQQRREREEEHFRKLDALLCQRGRRSGGRRKKRKI